MAEMPTESGTSFRAFICHTLNEQGFPAKDRSGRLELMEEPHLGRLMEKVKGKVRPASERLTHAIPQTIETQGE